MDNHTHYLLAGLDAPEVGAKVNLARAQSIAEILREIRRKVDVTPAGEWVASSAMYRGALAEGRFPNRYDLDSVAPDHPGVRLPVGQERDRQLIRSAVGRNYARDGGSHRA